MKTGPLVWIEAKNEWNAVDDVTGISYKIEFFPEYDGDNSSRDYYSVTERVEYYDSWVACAYDLPEAFEQVEYARRYARIRVLEQEIERLREGSDL